MKQAFFVLGLFLLVLFLGSCKKEESKDFYWIFLEDTSPIIQDYNYAYRLQDWAKGAISNFCSKSEHLKGRITEKQAYELLYQLEDLLCHTVQHRDSAEISEALEFYYYNEKKIDISRFGLLNEVLFTIDDMEKANDRMMYVFLSLYKIGMPYPILTETVYLKEYKFHH